MYILSRMDVLVHLQLHPSIHVGTASYLLSLYTSSHFKARINVQEGCAFDMQESHTRFLVGQLNSWK